MLSNHLRFGLPLVLFPGTSITITLLPTYSSSLLNAFISIPLQPTFLHFLGYFSQLRCSYFFHNSAQLGDFTHPINILISTTSNFFSCFLHSTCPGIGSNSHFPNSLPVDWYPSSHPSSNLHWTSGNTGFFLLISSPLSSIALLHSSSLFSTSSLLVLHNTMSSSYNIHHRDQNEEGAVIRYPDRQLE